MYYRMKDRARCRRIQRRLRAVSDHAHVEWARRLRESGATMTLPEAEGNFVHPDRHHCPTPEAFTSECRYQLGDLWQCPCGQVWRVYQLAHHVLWEKKRPYVRTLPYAAEGGWQQ